MKKLLFEFGVDLRFVAFAYCVTVLTVLLFSFGVPFLIVLQAFVTGESTSILLDNMRPGAIILMIPSTIFAVMALPYTFPASLVGWAITYKVASTLRCSPYLAAVASGLSAATFSSFAFGCWFEFGLTEHSSTALNASLLVLPSTLIAAFLASAVIYRIEKVIL